MEATATHTTKGSTMQINLTPLEVQFLKTCLNYDTAEDQKDDNFSNGGMDTAIALTGSRHGAAGLIGSLITKDLGYHDAEYDQFELYDKGIDAIFAITNQEEGA